MQFFLQILIKVFLVLLGYTICYTNPGLNSGAGNLGSSKLSAYQQRILLEENIQKQELQKLSLHRKAVRESALRMSDTLNRSQAYNIGFVLNTQVPQYLTERHTLAQQGRTLKLNPKNLGKNIFAYALTVAGIGAGTSLLKDYSETGQVRPEKALDFLQDSDFFKTTAGIFVGSTALTIAGHFLPPGVGPILKTVPGFLGAALGFEWAQGNLQNVDWMKIGLSSLVSSAAFVALGSGGIIAIGGGIAASMLSDQIYDFFKSKTSEGEIERGLPFEARFTEWEFEKANHPPPQGHNSFTSAEPFSQEHSGNGTQLEEYNRRELLKKIQNSASLDQREQTRQLLEALPEQR